MDGNLRLAPSCLMWWLFWDTGYGALLIVRSYPS
jgi:hypothetical protein